MLIGRYPAVLDANVLHPAFVRSALLWFADERLFQPLWSDRLLAEWRRSVQRRFPEVTDDQLDKLQGSMTSAFPDAEVTGYEPFVGSIELPDPDDRHVVAAALVGKASGIVTANTKDFPPGTLAPLAIEVVHPDDFIVNIIDLHPSRAVAACRRHREALSKSKPSPAAFLDLYAQAGLIQARQRLQPHQDLL